MDGNPKPDHTPTADPAHQRTVRQRTQLTMFESEHPWGPYKLFHRDDNWRGPDGSSGAYTPVIPPKWIGKDSMWVVWTQCCRNGQIPSYRISPPNHYNFTAQLIEFTTNRGS
jgi:hypothetical protein